MIVRVNAVLNRTVVYDSDGGFDNLCGGHLQSKVSSITSSGQRSAMMMAAFFEAVVCVICGLFVSLNTYTLVFFV